MSKIDDDLVKLGDSLFNQNKIPPTRQKKSMTGVSVKQAVVKPKSGANAIRSKLKSISKKAPVVMVKVSGGGKGMGHIKAHMQYITREGQLEMQDQDGNFIQGKDDLLALEKEWQSGGFRIPDDSNKREAFNIVLSMPAGTDPLAVRKAVSDFAKEEFSNHQYVMVLHTFETDPDPEPSPNPHVHLCVKARAMDGIRLNPRKADLQRWRELFAEKLQEHGVEATAANRAQRLKRERGEKQSVRYMKERGVELTEIGHNPVNPERINKAKKTEASVLKDYQGITEALAQSDNPEDRKLAASIVTYLSEQKLDKRVERAHTNETKTDLQR